MVIPASFLLRAVDAACLSHQPIAKRLHAGALQGTLGIDHVTGEAGGQAEFERPHQPACGKAVGNQGASAGVRNGLRPLRRSGQQTGK